MALFTRDEPVVAVPTAPATVSEEQLEREFVNQLSQNTVIEGNISTKDKMSFSSAIKGNINSTTEVVVKGGIIDGEVTSDSCVFVGGKERGNITCKTNASFDTGSVVIGDVRASDLVCDGKIKGNLFVDVSVTIGPNAVVFGNIRSAEINIDPGAIIKGSIEVVRQSMAAVRAFDFEEEFLNIDDYLAGMQ
ncbi:MAG: polymer-forming cytoskeletal protein [Oscillospiraceae bacterium]|nr:polymer-forming cytoskeletal protein [Oscillospiraceae bacterium]MBR2740871.1 polymer-forming cytoskeletal protein [Oscillospiraceae bacterium]